jgi:hypothetical protein
MGKPSDSDDKLDHALQVLAKQARRPFERLPVRGPTDVPDDLILRVVEGLASAEERSRVSAAGPYTQARLADLQAGLAEAGALPSPLVRAARFVFLRAQDALEVVRSSVAPLPMPAAHAVRGTAPSGGPAMFEFDERVAELPVRLRVERVGDAIDVQLRLPAGESARVTLSRQGDVVDSAPVGKDGVATFRGLGDAAYALEIRRAGADAPRGTIELDIRS